MKKKLLVLEALRVSIARNYPRLIRPLPLSIVDKSRGKDQTPPKIAISLNTN